MIQDLLLRWIVTALFVISATERGYCIAAGRLPPTDLVGNSLQALMAIAMAVMAWPGGAGLAATGPLLFFLLAALWFLAVSVGRAKHRRANAYHVMMMLATAWMYAAMGGGLLPAPHDVASADGRHGSSSMPGMDMPAMETAPGAGGTPPFFTGLNWLLTIAFAVAGAGWSWWLFVRRRTAPSPPGRVQAGIAAQAVMAAGMAIMFAVLP
ncbi:DUF5134 domain-containing protein [Amycolatopsis sp. FDAARGOS 1241]|uniref:DUF5134 domain-containing protein n=1 Tax=Amycolatopsis sp. FDAARGOS 1241 TaxID=2778070 RepID=UPI00194F4DC5|nr:DUF5134 domain-containing protein [Amycolatopsis sp. FDAARGOS 1241]QRP50444.1 DUF5134 domain-containing protein [Amycolatopsis sp. FDAARGOS 1241]